MTFNSGFIITKFIFHNFNEFSTTTNGDDYTFEFKAQNKFEMYAKGYFCV